MTSLLELDGVHKRFGGLAAVRDVSFRVDAGQTVGLLGPNGSGKTTVLNVISGALPPSAGVVRLRGTEISRLRADRIARLGVARTFQLVRVLPSLSLQENVVAGVAFGRRRAWGAEARDRAAEALATVGLGDRSGESAGALTYIDQKRLELARALVAEPDLLLLDEWLSGLNPTELHAAVGLIRGLEARGITILLVEHIMDAVRALCGRCVVMNAGAVIADGDTAAVLRDPAVVSAYLGDGHA